MESTEKTIAKFTAAREVRIVSPGGDQCMNFAAGQTRAVHKSMWSVAIASGLMPEESLEETTAAPEVEVPEVPSAQLSQEATVAAGLQKACKTLIARGDPNDFTQLGQPRASSVKKLVDFDFTANDVRLAFEQAMFEVEDDGNNGEEPAESSSSTTE